MIQYKYLPAFLLLASLAYMPLSASADTSGTETFGSAATGWDTSTPLNPVANPDSIVKGQSYGVGTSADPSAIRPTQPQGSNYDYTQNIPGPNQGAMLYPMQNEPTGLVPMTGNGYALPKTSQINLTPVNPKVKANAFGLPPTTLDSFVQQAGGAAEAIYGDEGTMGIPPASSFGVISNGFNGQTKKGLTTGHGSYMPEASGDGWSTSGPNYAATQANTAAAINAIKAVIPTN